MTAVATESRVTPSLAMRPEHLSPAMLMAAGCVAAYAASLVSHGGAATVAAVFVVLDLVVHLLPWGLPRSTRTVPSLWVETLAGMGFLLAFVAVAVWSGHSWLTLVPQPWWFAVAIAVGVGIVAVSGLDVRRLRDGDLAFILGPVRRPHGWARMATALFSPAGEEAAFRGVLLTVGPGALPTALLGAAAFVARHHVPSDSAKRRSTRAVLTEITAAAALLLLTLASGSIYPALVAHMINNLPQVVLEYQRAYGATT